MFLWSVIPEGEAFATPISLQSVEASAFQPQTKNDAFDRNSSALYIKNDDRLVRNLCHSAHAEV